jgi:hypothetical protein
MRQRSRNNPEDVLWVMDQKTAALKRIHRLCNDLLDDGEDALTARQIKKIRQIASDHWPTLEYTEADRNIVVTGGKSK